MVGIALPSRAVIPAVDETRAIASWVT